MDRKRVLSALLCTALCLGLAACAGEKAPPADDSAALPAGSRSAAYAQAITDARDAETNETTPVVSADSEADPAELEMTFAVLGFDPEDVQDYAVSLSLMNVRAYAVVAVTPAEGREETVKTGLENYIETQKGSFEHYLEDQYEVAANAKLETLDDGTLLLVMCPGQDEVLSAIKTALAG